MEEHLDAILQIVREKPICALSAPTGSGKSTLVPAHLAQKHGPVMVVCPTIVACVRLAEYVSHIYTSVGIGAGQQITYDVHTQLIFVTPQHATNLLTRKQPFNTIFLDEIHTVSAEYELLLAFMYHYWSPEWRIVFSSACVPHSILNQWSSRSEVNLIEIEQKRFEVVETFEHKCLLKSPNDDFTVLCDRVMDKLHEWNQLGISLGITLVFVPGEEYMQYLFNRMQRFEWNIVCISSQTDRIDDFCSRTIVLTTDVLESGVTLPDVCGVIDLGLQKVPMKCEEEGVKLTTIFESKSSALQRAGRTGRTGPGHVHRMFTKQMFDGLNERYDPVLSRTSIHHTLLDLRAFEPDPFAILQHAHVSKTHYDQTFNDLIQWKFLLPNGSLSEEASHIVCLPIHSLPLRRIWYQLLTSASPLHQQVGAYIISIAEMERDGSLTFLPRRVSREDLLAARAKFATFEQDSTCSMHSAVNALFDFYRTRTVLSSNEWCQRYSMNHKMLQKLLIIVKRLLPDEFMTDLSNNDIGVVIRELTPLFQTFLKTFRVDAKDRWWTESNKVTFYRLNSRSFGPWNFSRCIALTCSYIQKHHLIGFLTSTLPIASTVDESSSSEEDLSPKRQRT